MNQPDGSSQATQPSQIHEDVAEISDDPRVVEVVQEYLGELEAGKSPPRASYINRYPELAEAISQCLDGLDLIYAGVPERLSQVRERAGRIELGRVDQAATGPLPNPLGDFQIVRELARGGMGIVYEAIQLSLDRRVALKVLPFAATFDSRQLQRFKNEAHAAALLHHTHIVPIYAVGCERGVHFYAMQLIDGQSLDAVIKELRLQAGIGTERNSDGRDHQSHVLSTVLRGEPHSMIDARGDALRDQPLPKIDQVSHSTVNVSAAMTADATQSTPNYFRKIARLMIQAAEALEHAHQQGLVHRDIKPANLLVDSHGMLWITDFGLAQFQTDTGLTRSGDLLGTYRYMSPEQTTGRRMVLDHRTDIYSLERHSTNS